MSESAQSVLKPEERARVKIDQLMQNAGWQVVPRAAYSPALSAAAIEEGILRGGLEADYLLFLDGKAIGVLEAKKEGTDLETVAAAQAENYTHQVPSWVKTWFPGQPLPLVYLSDGKHLLHRADDGTYHPLAEMHTPLQIATRLQLPSFTAGYPFLSPRGLRKCQIDALAKLEASLRTGHPRALLVLATGAGKTFTACAAAYRMLTYGRIDGRRVRRVLFLVDRNNLGEQTEGEFGKYRLTETGESFTSIYETARIQSHNLPERINLAISTIQRLYALLTGTEMRTDAEEDETDLDALTGATVTLPGGLALPHDYFDAIIVDECHRSIYGRWRAVLDYFSAARVIGLTATPTEETRRYFNDNVVSCYTLDQSIVDNVNVDYRVYRIQTDTTTHGGTIAAGEQVRTVTRLTGATTVAPADAAATFGANELDRSVVSPAQIRLVLEQYRDAVYRDLYVGDLARDPDFAALPKTLIFAKSEEHAREIVRIAREVFPGQAPDFVQSITYSADSPKRLIQSFRTSRTFRIAVTVTLIATGTDVRALEVLLFLRDIHSDLLYQQMRGRGVRRIDDDELLAVTPNARGGKQLFFLVDAVGVTTSEKHLPPPHRPDEHDHVPTLAELLELLAHGNLGDDNLRLFASRLARLAARTDPKRQMRFSALTDGHDLKDLAETVFEALDGSLPPFTDLNAPNEARAALVAPVIARPEARAYLLELNAGYQTVLLPGHDELIYTGFSQEEARIVTDAFRAYVEEALHTVPALEHLHSQPGWPLLPSDLEDLDDILVHANHRFTIPFLWNAYVNLDPRSATPFATPAERTALTNWIPLVRRAFGDPRPLHSIPAGAARYYELWKGQQQRDALSPEADELMRQLLPLIASSGTYTTAILTANNEMPTLARGRRAFGSVPAFDAALKSLSQFLITNY